MAQNPTTKMEAETFKPVTELTDEEKDPMLDYLESHYPKDYWCYLQIGIACNSVPEQFESKKYLDISVYTAKSEHKRNQLETYLDVRECTDREGPDARIVHPRIVAVSKDNGIVIFGMIKDEKYLPFVIDRIDWETRQKDIFVVWAHYGKKKHGRISRMNALRGGPGKVKKFDYRAFRMSLLKKLTFQAGLVASYMLRKNFKHFENGIIPIIAQYCYSYEETVEIHNNKTVRLRASEEREWLEKHSCEIIAFLYHSSQMYPRYYFE